MAKEPIVVAPPPVPEPLRVLERAIEREGGSAKAWAKRAGLSRQYVYDVRSGKRAPGPAILLALGLVRVVSYEPSAAQREAR